MKTSLTIAYASIGLLLATIMLAFIYWYPVEKPGEIGQSAALTEQGIALYKQQKYGEVLQKLDEIPDHSVTDWRIPYYKGSAQIMLKDYENAVILLEQALAMNNQGTGILYALGVANFKQGNLKLAKGYFAAVLAINPVDENAKGLVDVIAKLERRQSNEPTSIPEQKNDDN